MEKYFLIMYGMIAVGTLYTLYTDNKERDFDTVASLIFCSIIWPILFGAGITAKLINK